MQTITNEQIYDRWEQVPEALKEAFFSLENGEAIWAACEEMGLPAEVIDQVLIVVGNILLGFTHINDLAKELQSIPGMDLKAVDPIIFQADRKIFAPIKGDILKLYGEMSGTGPRVAAAEVPAGAISARASLEAPAMIAGEARPEPRKEIQAEQEAPAAVQVDIRKVRIGEEMNMEESVAPVVAEVKQKEAQIEAPAIIHAEAELQQVVQKKRSLSSFGGMFGFGRTHQEPKKEGTSVVAARVSMAGGAGKKQEDAMRTTEQQPVRVVHYTSAQAPEDIFAKAAQPQKEAATMVPVTKQEHPIDFEPKMVDLAQPTPIVESVRPMSAQPLAVAVPIPAMPEEGGSVAAMPKIPQATVMKTPQRVETPVAAQPQIEPRLAEIPVSDDVVDLRSLERMTNNK